jgi:hypothetical protein
MNHLTNFYKNKSEQLQERYDNLLNLLNQNDILVEQEGAYHDASREAAEKARAAARREREKAEGKFRNRLGELTPEEFEEFLKIDKAARDNPDIADYYRTQYERTRGFGETLKRGGKNFARVAGGIGVAIPAAIATNAALSGMGLEGSPMSDTATGAISTAAGMGAGSAAMTAMTPPKLGQMKPSWKAEAMKGAGLGLVYGALWEPASWVAQHGMGLTPGDLSHTIASSLMSQAPVDATMALIPGGAPMTIGRAAKNLALWGVALPSAVHGTMKGVDNLLSPDEEEIDSWDDNEINRDMKEKRMSGKDINPRLRIIRDPKTGTERLER